MTNETAPRDEYVNVKEGAARILNKKELYVKMLKSFINQNRWNDLRAALTQADLQAASAHAHTIKGVAANLSLTALSKAMLQLETEIKNGRTDGFDVAALEECMEKTLFYVNEVINEG